VSTGLRAATAAALALALPLGLAACGGGGGSSDVTGAAATVVSTNDACTPDKTTLPAGKQKLVVKNEGSNPTELYVYEGDKVKAEVENVGPGTSRSLTVTLTAGGSWQLACKPGGTTIKVPITVS
jgi:iron uptake system component EfeO